MNLYKTKRWKRTRLACLNAYKYECQESKRYGISKLANTVHHIYPYEQYPELAFEEWNLLPLTHKEHNAMHDRDSHELTSKGIYWQRKKRKQFNEYMKNKNDFI